MPATFYEFKLGAKLTTVGPVVDVNIPVDIFTKFEFEPVQFTLDTGSDFTVMPNHMARQIGIDLSQCQRSKIYGLAKEPIKAYLAIITMRLGKKEFPLRCLISERNDTPFLLGRVDIFDKFNIEIDNIKGVIRFIEISQ